VTSVVWSSDSSKLYSASDKFARVIDSASGTELHHFKHDSYLNSIALSPTHNLLACVGFGGIAQLWDTESYQPLGEPLSLEDNVALHCVSFSRDGRYLARSGGDGNITLWMVKDIAPQLALPASTTQKETLPEPAPLSYLDVSTLTFHSSPCS
jgi:WD40 repeat protein